MILTTSQVIEKFVEADEIYGLSSVFEGTFGGKLLFDKELNSFIWMSDIEFENLQYETEKAAKAILFDRSRTL